MSIDRDGDHMALTDPNHPRNVSWSRDELILALDFYVRSKGNPPGKSAAEIGELSALLNRIAASGSQGTDYRNPNGVYMKLMNFRRFDPVYRPQAKTGLTRGNKLEEAVWDEFAAAPDRLTKTASAIVANLDDNVDIRYAYEVPGDRGSRERQGSHSGTLGSRAVKEAGRNQKGGLSPSHR
jgi:hypothetical protein